MTNEQFNTLHNDLFRLADMIPIGFDNLAKADSTTHKGPQPISEKAAFAQIDTLNQRLDKAGEAFKTMKTENAVCIKELGKIAERLEQLERRVSLLCSAQTVAPKPKSATPKATTTTPNA